MTALRGELSWSWSETDRWQRARVILAREGLLKDFKKGRLMKKRGSKSEYRNLLKKKSENAPMKVFSAENAPIQWATLFAHSVELCRRIECEVDQPPLILDLKIELKQQHFEHDSVRIENATGAATILEVATGHGNETTTSLIAEHPTAKTIYQSLIDTLKEQAKLESELLDAEECKKSLRQMRENLVHERAIATLPSLEQLVSTNFLTNFLTLSTQITKAIATIDQNCLDLQANIRSTQDECIRLKREIARLCDTDFYLECSAAEGLKNAAEVLGCCRVKTTQHVVVKCKVEKAGPIKFDLIYTLNQASWSPAYNLRASTADPTQAELTYFGVVKQSTKEDWKDIKLVLSTGSPSLAGHPGSLPPLKVGYRVEVQKFGRSVDGSAQPCDVSASFRASKCLMGMAFTEPAAKEASPQAAFALTGLYSVPADGEAHKLAVTRTALATKMFYYAFPEADQVVFRAALLKNTTDFFLLPSAAASVFWDDSFVAKTTLPAVPPGGDFQTFLGREMKVQLEIQPLRKYRKTAGSMFTGGTTDKEVYEYNGWVENLKADAIVLMLAFRVPRSSDETIKVQLDPALGKPISLQCRTDLEIFGNPNVPQADARNPTVVILNESTDHCVTINFLQPGQKANINCSYFIERPANKVIEIV